MPVIPVEDYSPQDSAQTLGGLRPWGGMFSAKYGDDVGNAIPGTTLTGFPAQIAGLANGIVDLQAADTAINERIDDAEDVLVVCVKYDADGNVTLPAGTIVRVSIPGGAIENVLATDTNGNIVIGEQNQQVNIIASQRPTIQVGTDAPQDVATMQDVAGLVTDAELQSGLDGKADLVGGKISASVFPDGIIPLLWPVSDSSQLTTLTSATVNDNAYITGGTDAGKVFKLVQDPPTTAGNWVDISNTSAVVSVNGMDGAVTISLANLPDVQTAINAKANAADLSSYAKLASPAFTGSPTAPTPAASASGQEIMTAAAVNTKLTGNLSSTSPAMNGTANSGSSTSVSRGDHVHPTDTTRAPLASPGFTGTPTAPTAGAATNNTQIATTAFAHALITYGTSAMADGASLTAGVIYAQY